MPARDASRSAMTKLRSLGKFGGFCAVVGAALFLATAIVSPLRNARNFLGNPFGFVQTIAPSGPVVLSQLQKLARLETGKFNGQTIVTGQDKGVLPVFLAGDRLVFIAHGEVVAGVDLAKMNEGDVQMNGDTATVRLPAAEVFHASLNNKTSEVFERQTGIFSQPDRDLETQTRQTAEDRLREAALNSGLLESAQNNARDAVRRQLELLGIKNVRFV